MEITGRREAYERERQRAIDEYDRLFDRPQPLLYTWNSPEWRRYRYDRERRLASLQRQITGLTDILESIHQPGRAHTEGASNADR